MNVMVLVLALAVPGQFAGPEKKPDARERRAAREACIGRNGDCCRKFVEAYGEDAVGALNRCSAPVARKLAVWHDAGSLDRLARPESMLKSIAKRDHGDEVALFAIQNAEKLAADADMLAAYVETPLEYALGLQSLEQGAAQARAKRLHAESSLATKAQQFSLDDRNTVWLVGGVVGVTLLLLWRSRRNRHLPLVSRIN